MIGCCPELWWALMLLWPPVRDVGSGSILTWGRVWGAGRPNVTFGTNKKLSINP